MGKYTRNGAVEEGLEIKPGKQFPEPLGDLMVGALFSWELDVWKKLRNAKNLQYSNIWQVWKGKILW